MTTMTNLEQRSINGAALALTYAERVISDGALMAGLADGYGVPTFNAQTMRSECLSHADRRGVIRDARKAYATFRALFGYASASASMLTTPDAQPKLGKSVRHALGLMLVPANGVPDDMRERAGIARAFNVCPLASLGCVAACLSQSGHGAFPKTQYARAVRTLFLMAHPYDAGVLIGAETRRAVDRHGVDGVTLRLNVTSDIRWERLAGGPETLRALMARGVRVYDYSAHKPETRALAESLGVRITYSAKERAHTSDAYLADILASGRNVAMPFHVAKGDALPTHYVIDGRTFIVIDGDLSDDRTEDPHGVIVGLRAKGSRGKRDASGFIRDPRDGGLVERLSGSLTPYGA
jgi:hypothetical protein